jgi:hypothetical protein
MAQARPWIVHPDPETGVVDDDDAIQALAELWVMLKRGGGAAQLIPRRAPDAEFPDVRHTVRLDIQWLSRTDTAPTIEPADDEPAVGREPAESARA